METIINQENGYIKITLPATAENKTCLDELMEACLIPGYETRKENATVIDIWEKREELFTRLQEMCPHTDGMQVEHIEDQDWNLTWIDGFVPIEVVPAFWITPPWHLDKIPDGQRRIIINPGEAFGTGTHESTQLALELMQTYLKEGAVVRDLGCGSGILSLAAEQLGALSVDAVDFDPDISRNMNENLELNGAKHISWEIGDVLTMDDYSCDLALINIQKHIIIPLLEKMTNMEGKRPAAVILSGLLGEHEKEMKAVLQGSPYEVTDIKHKNEWMAIAARERR